MRDFGEYLRAYRAYVSANLGWGKALMGALTWLAGMFAPLWAKTLVRVAELGRDNVDDCLGVAGLYFCALRNVETPPHSDCELRSARLQIVTSN